MTAPTRRDGSWQAIRLSTDGTISVDAASQSSLDGLGQDSGSITSELAAGVMRLSALRLADLSLDAAVELIISVVTDTLPATAGATLTLNREVTRSAVGRHTARTYLELPELEEGPCRTAWQTGAAVRVDDLSRDDRWPDWAAVAGPAGVRAALSCPLVAGGDEIGVLTAYSTTRSAYRNVEPTLHLLADRAAILLSNLLALQAAQRTNAHLRTALQTRDVIAQAKGVLLARGAATDADEAFRQLATESQRRNLKLYRVAEEIVERVAEVRRSS